MAEPNPNLKRLVEGFSSRLNELDRARNAGNKPEIIRVQRLLEDEFDPLMELYEGLFSQGRHTAGNNALMTNLAEKVDTFNEKIKSTSKKPAKTLRSKSWRRQTTRRRKSKNRNNY